MLSIANVPWLGKSFTGFLDFLHHEGITYNFATYTNAKIDVDILNSDEVKIVIVNKKKTFTIEEKRSETFIYFDKKNYI